MTDGQLVAALIAALAPAVLALFKRLNISKEAQSAIILGVLVVFAGLAMLASGDIDTKACSGLDLMACVQVVYGYVGAVLGSAFVSYKLFWGALGIDDKIAGK
jgi:di/tricarboxylate transporter